MQVTAINTMNLSDFSTDSQSNGSLEDRFMAAFSNSSEAFFQDKMMVMNGINDPINTSDPEKLMMFQNQSSEYNISLSFYSALTRKYVNAVDTLLRS